MTLEDQSCRSPNEAGGKSRGSKSASDSEADLQDADLLSSGRNPGNAPALVHLAVDRLVQAVIVTERGWPVGSDGRDDLDLVPDENPLKPMLVSATRSGSSSGPPAVRTDGSAPVLPDRQKLREGILAARALLKNLAARFEVDCLETELRGEQHLFGLSQRQYRNPRRWRSRLCPHALRWRQGSNKQYHRSPRNGSFRSP
jgi:hypothetical protein